MAQRLASCPGLHRVTARRSRSQACKHSNTEDTDHVRAIHSMGTQMIRGRCVPTWYARQKTGYSILLFRGVTMHHSRARWIERYGPLPRHIHVLHKCDNPWCVNLRHLFLGTHQDNMRDMVKKGRKTSGEKHPHSKVTWKMVEQIKKLRLDGATQTSIAAAVGICKSHVGRILNGERWKR